MLDVDGRIDVDSRLEHVLDVLVALLVLAPGRVGVGELVDQGELGRAGDHRGDVHLVHHPLAVLDRSPRDDLEADRLGDRLGAVVRLEIADDDVAARLRLRLPLLEHPVSLAHPGRHPKEDLVTTAAVHADLRPRSDR